MTLGVLTLFASSTQAREIEQLEAEIAAGAPASGTNPLALASNDSGGYASARAFEALPLSQVCHFCVHNRVCVWISIFRLHSACVYGVCFRATHACSICSILRLCFLDLVERLSFFAY